MSNIPTKKRTGIIFRPGAYGSKGVYSDADIDAMAGDNPLPVNLEHRKSLLSDKLGFLTRRFSGFDENGQKVLMGEWHEPEPLAALLGDTTRKASIEIDMATKQPTGLALTHLPHIADAALFYAVDEAFAKFSRGEEIEPLSDDVNNLIQETQPIMNTETPVVEIPKVSFMDQVKALFSGAKPEELAEVEGALTHAKTGKTPRELELETKLAKFELDESAKFSAVVNEKAIAFADKLVADKKIVAKGNDAYEATIALFSIAAHFEDAKPQLACFSDDFKVAEFKAVDALTTLFSMVPNHDKNAEKVGGLEPEKIAVFEQSKTTTKDAHGNEVDWAEVNRARKENGLPEAKVSAA